MTRSEQIRCFADLTFDGYIAGYDIKQVLYLS